MERIISEHHDQLVKHPIYGELNSLAAIRSFMENHIFAVWDFMSLLKALQNKLTCTSVPWRPSPYSSEVVRMINEIVLAEESDVDQEGNACSHFELYLRAMKEVGADTQPINRFLETLKNDHLPEDVKTFVEFNLDLSENGRVEEVAAAFFYGREKLLPDVFTQIVKVLREENIPCPTLTYYFERHIELDGDHHGPLALKCLDEICANDPATKCRANYAGIQALRQRIQLWDATLEKIQSQKSSLASVQ
ncbi:MAG: DUF3050 domain-containing protein [Bdellovibrionota bacterium]|jgi:hypothetical protein|nr:DUF3050 domain-containing protein [Bdellovibrionota bacterium]